MEAHEHEYGRQVHPGSNRLGAFFFFLSFHLKCIQSTLSNSICCTCLLLLLLCLAAALTLLQQQGKGGKRRKRMISRASWRKRMISRAQLGILPRLLGSAAGTESPAGGSGRLKSSSAQSCAAACRSQRMQLLPSPPNQLLPVIQTHTVIILPQGKGFLAVFSCSLDCRGAEAALRVVLGGAGC